MATKNAKNSSKTAEKNVKAEKVAKAPKAKIVGAVVHGEPKAPTKSKNAELVKASKGTKAAPTKSRKELLKESHERAVAAAEQQAAKVAKRQAEEVLPPVVDGFSHCPSCGVYLTNGWHDGKTREYQCLKCLAEFGRELKQPAAAKEQKAKEPKAAAPILNRSEVESPTARVWDIADSMVAKDPNVRRKDVIEACCKSGIAFNTARTQYQLWYRAQRA